jgi:hypothetical protein
MKNDLSPLLAKVVEILNQNNYVSTFKFRRIGIASPPQCIAELKKRGAIIETITKEVTDELGIVYKGIAQYRLLGWSL